jgi:hypothetical protein
MNKEKGHVKEEISLNLCQVKNSIKSINSQFKHRYRFNYKSHSILSYEIPILKLNK